MKRILKFNRKYFGIAILLFIIEVLIALFVHDSFIRPYIGDFLVVILLYCFFKSFLNIPELPLAIAVLLFSYCVEVLQFFNVAELLGLKNYKIATIIIGTFFAWADILAYTFGIAIVVFLEKCICSNIKTQIDIDKE